MEAMLVAVPATILAGAAWRNAGKAKKATATSNGMTTGEMVEETHSDVKEMRTWLIDHIRDRELHN